MIKIIFREYFFPVLCRIEFYEKITASLLLAIYLFSATATRELLKLPVLAEHYYDHRKENKNIGFVAFLIMHYYTEDGTDKDAEEDNQLPFKSAEHAATVSFISLTPPLSIEIVPNPESENNNSFGIRNDLFLPSQYLAAIWQPPRHCRFIIR